MSDNSRPGPMSGVRILDLSQVISGPMAASWLSDQGADVIKVETPGTGDIARWLGPRKADISALFYSANRGKKSVVLDLKGAQADRDILWQLLSEADVLVENFRPGALARLGFGPDEVLARAPRLIYCSITGYGPEGPYSGGRVYDPIIQAVSGICASQADPATGEPRLVQTLICDKTTAMVAAQAITAALFARERTGKGQLVELSMLDTALAWLWPEGMYNDTFVDTGDPRAPEFGDLMALARTRDGWFAISGVQDSEFAAFCRALDRADLITDPRFADIAGRMQNADALRQELAAAYAATDSRPLMQRMLEEGAPGARVNSREDIVTDPQIAANGTLVETEEAGLGRVRQPRHPVRFHATPCADPAPAPHLGEHTEEVRRSFK